MFLERLGRRRRPKFSPAALKNLNFALFWPFSKIDFRIIKKGPPPIGVKNFLGGGAFLINRNLEIGRRPKILSILSRKMKGKRVFRAFGAPQAPKIFACGAKIPLIFSIFRYRFFEISIY